MEYNEYIEGYKSFLSNGKTERECVSIIEGMAKKAGYKPLSEAESVKSGDKVYFIKMKKSIILFEIGSGKISDGMNILGAHIDSPRLDLKQSPLYEKDSLAYFNTHYYGGIKKFQWLTLPLALHGVVCLKNGKCVTLSIGEDESDPVFCITDILPHLGKEQAEKKAGELVAGEDLDVLIGSGIPSKGEKKEGEESESAKKVILKILKDKYGFEEEDFLSAEIEVVPAGKAREAGLDRSMILGYGQDDRACSYASASAMVESLAKKRTTCCICVDKEEIGSVGASGMESLILSNAVSELVSKMSEPYSELKVKRALSSSFMLSSDVSAAFDPLYPSVFEKDNVCYLNGGLVFNKYTGSRGKSGANDASAEYIAKVRKCMDEAKVVWQTSELVKVDAGGGGTIAYLAARYGMNVIDAGVPVLSMHSPWEISSKKDMMEAFKGYKAFLENME